MPVDTFCSIFPYSACMSPSDREQRAIISALQAKLYPYPHGIRDIGGKQIKHIIWKAVWTR